MKPKISILLLGLIVGIVSYWFHTAGEEAIMGISIYSLLAAGSLITASLFSFITDTRAFSTAALVVAGTMIAVIARIIYDRILDPTAHSLFPKEILIVSLIAFIPAILGAYLGKFGKYII